MQTAPVQAVTSYSSPQQLKENINTFLNLDREKQRSILGELLYPIVERLVENHEDAPKITGMLIDFEVFEVEEVIAFFNDPEQLRDRIREAQELLEESKRDV